MAFKDILNKGMSMISSGVEKAKSEIEAKNAAIKEFDLLKTSSNHIGPMNAYEVKNNDPQGFKEQIILNECLTINVENSKVINSLIPVDETIVAIRTGKEAKTEIDYLFAVTDKRLWILNKKEYMTLEFSQMINAEIINKGVMSQGVKFNNNAFIIDGNETDVKKFLNVLMNAEFRNNEINNHKNYLCGIVPKRQIINTIFKGITIGVNGEIILHNGNINKVVNPKEIVSVQLLLNDSVTIVRGKGETGNMMANPIEARKMSVKVILGMGEFVIETMPSNVMNTSYKREDSTYIKNYEFSKSIVDCLADIIRNTF